jgi:hypothetical protein
MKTHEYRYWQKVVRYGNVPLSTVPRHIVDYSLCLDAVDRTGWALMYIPTELMDHALCLAAVARNGRALQHVPTQFRDYQLCKTAVLRVRHAIMFVPADLPGREFLEILASSHENI